MFGMHHNDYHHRGHGVLSLALIGFLIYLLFQKHHMFHHMLNFNEDSH